MHLAALVESTEHVCCRYRLGAFASKLADAGHRLDFHRLPKGLWQRWRIGLGTEGADAVIVQRKLLSGGERALLRRRARRLIFDFDDALWLRDSYSPKGHVSARRRRRFQALLGECSLVIAGSAYLARQAEQCAAGVPVAIIPTCVDVDRYPPARHDRPAGAAELVWIGSSSTLRGLEAIAPTLEQVGRKNPGVRLKLICDRFIELQHLPVIACPWAEATEAAEIAATDIGISAVPDDPWSRGKCGLKVLQYMAGGLPVVANPVGVQAEMVEHGKTGFLASTKDEWAEAIRLLAADPELRRRMGRAGRAAVEEKYSVGAGAQLWLGLLSRLAVQRASA